MMPVKRRYFVLMVIAAGLLVWLAASGCGSSSPSPTTTPQAENTLIDDPSIGPEDAPVTIHEYADFSCPHCAIWQDQGVLDQLFVKYGDQIRFVRHDYAVLTPQSRPAALAARCAGDQGKYWEYHDVLYDSYPELEVSDLKRYAADMGLDTATFDQCLDTQKHFDEVAAGLKDGMDHGLFATPSFMVNDKRVLGGQPFEVFVSTIDPLLGTSQ